MHRFHPARIKYKIDYNDENENKNKNDNEDEGTLSEMRSLSSLTSLARKDPGGLERVDLDVRKTCPPTFSLTQSPAQPPYLVLPSS